MTTYRMPQGVKLEDFLAKLHPLADGLLWLTNDVVLQPTAAGGHLALWVAYLAKLEKLEGAVDGAGGGKQPRLWVHRIDLGYLSGAHTIGVDADLIDSHVKAFLKELEDGTAIEVKDGGELP